MRNDPDRLAALRHLMILDTPAERSYDDITRMLAAALGVPIAIVKLLDEGRDWFKSCIGLSQTESPAATSFCETFFGMTEDLIVVEDTMLDPRFAAHPLVAGAPYIRFYAACRLEIDGRTVGTLCAYDLQPRKVSREQLAEMQSLANAAVSLLRRG